MSGPKCADWDVAADQVGGLCPECVTGCYWIVRPVAHREMTRRRHAVDAAYYTSLGSWAFYIPCATNLAGWPDAWATPRPCGCLACSQGIEQALAVSA